MPTCPDCGGIMIMTGERDKKVKRGRRTFTETFVMLDCIDCGSGIDVPKAEDEE